MDGYGRVDGPAMHQMRKAFPALESSQEQMARTSAQSTTGAVLLTWLCGSASAKRLTLFIVSATKLGKITDINCQILAARIVKDDWGVATSLAELFGTTKAGFNPA